MKYLLKDMVCLRCTMVVESILKSHGMNPTKVQIGSFTVPSVLNSVEKAAISKELEAVGFSFIENDDEVLAAGIKVSLHKLVFSDEQVIQNYSDILEEEYDQSYKRINQIFSGVYGRTIHQEIVRLKIDFAMQLLQDRSNSIKAVAEKVGYSSVSHFISQFKNHTGKTPVAFREDMLEQNR